MKSVISTVHNREIFIVFSKFSKCCVICVNLLIFWQDLLCLRSVRSSSLLCYFLSNVNSMHNNQSNLCVQLAVAILVYTMDVVQWCISIRELLMQYTILEPGCRNYPKVLNNKVSNMEAERVRQGANFWDIYWQSQSHTVSCVRPACYEGCVVLLQANVKRDEERGCSKLLTGTLG